VLEGAIEMIRHLLDRNDQIKRQLQQHQQQQQLNIRRIQMAYSATEGKLIWLCLKGLEAQIILSYFSFEVSQYNYNLIASKIILCMKYYSQYSGLIRMLI
jgi:hypothetical protein